ncbi:MAG: branched-chain amino acid ABC transporter permease [Dehalococcoidia bacterium]|nr:branched-chain amino acid ABC transporter permease [Dehalococcoidia bacterium]
MSATADVIRARVARVRNMPRVSRPALVLLAVMVLLPVFGNPYMQSVFISIGLYATVAMGLVLITGLAGQVSLGQGVFYGSGAYISALLSMRLGLSPWLAIPLAAAASGLLAVPIGRAILRLRGIIVAGVTLTVNLIFYYLVISVSGLTGGATGLVQIPRLSYPKVVPYTVFVYYLVWIMAFVALVLTSNIASSRVGRALKSVNVLAGGTEDTGQVLGIDPMHYKVLAFVVAAFFAGMAGGVYAHHTSVIEPGTFSVNMSVLVAIMVIVGGVSSPWGAIVGSALIVLLTEFLREVAPIVLGGPTGAYELVAYGVVLVVSLLFLPAGLYSLPSRMSRWRKERRI